MFVSTTSLSCPLKLHGPPECLPQVSSCWDTENSFKHINRRTQLDGLAFHWPDGESFMRQEQGRHFEGAFQKPVPWIYFVKHRKKQVEENVLLVSRNLLAVPAGATVGWKNPRISCYFTCLNQASLFQTSPKKRKEALARSIFYRITPLLPWLTVTARWSVQIERRLRAAASIWKQIDAQMAAERNAAAMAAYSGF